MLAVLPALTHFVFGGDSEYLEDLVAQIDAPRVDDVRIECFAQEVQTRSSAARQASSLPNSGRLK